MEHSIECKQLGPSCSYLTLPSRVIYGDTDSVMLTLGGCVTVKPYLTPSLSYIMYHVVRYPIHPLYHVWMMSRWRSEKPSWTRWCHHDRSLCCWKRGGDWWVLWHHRKQCQACSDACSCCGSCCGCDALVVVAVVVVVVVVAVVVVVVLAITVVEVLQ